MSEYRDDLLKYWEDQKLDHLTVPRLVDHTGRKGL